MRDSLNPITRKLLTFESGRTFEVSARIRTDGIHSDQTIIVIKRKGLRTRSCGFGFTLLAQWAEVARRNEWAEVAADWPRMTPKDIDAIFAWLAEQEQCASRTFFASGG